MTCKELIEFLDRYVSGSLAGESRTLFDQHLEICPECADYLDSYRTTIRLGRESLRSDGAGGVEPPMPEDLVKAILAATSGDRR